MKNIIIVIIFIVAAGFVGWKVWQSEKNAPEAVMENTGTETPDAATADTNTNTTMKTFIVQKMVGGKNVDAAEITVDGTGNTQVRQLTTDPISVANDFANAWNEIQQQATLKLTSEVREGDTKTTKTTEVARGDKDYIYAIMDTLSRDYGFFMTEKD